MLYIMHRTQIYIDDDLWAILQARATQEHTSVSALIRTAARKNYSVDYAARAAAMQAFVGLWKDRDDLPDTETYVRELRRGDRRQKMLNS